MTTKTLSMLCIASLALVLGGCNGAFVGNFFVLFVSAGIFFGTLNLGRFTPGGSPRTPTKGSSATESSS